MHQRQRRDHALMAQIRIIICQLFRHEHALVDHRPHREAGNVKPFAAVNPAAVTDLLLRQFADDIKFALERRFILQRRVAPNEHLRHVRLGGDRRLAERRIVRRHIAPAEQRLALGGNNFGERGLDPVALQRILRQEQHARAVFAGRRQLEAELRRHLDEKFMRRLDEDARAVARVRLAADRAAMIEVHENPQSVRHQLMGFLAFHVDDETDAARVMLELRVIKSLFQRCARRRLTDLIGGRHYFLVMARRISLRSLIFYSFYFRAQ